MKNWKSTYLIVAMSLFTGGLHFLIGPDYQGMFKPFVRGYLIDIILPLNLYLLLQISLRKHLTVLISRLSGAVFTFSFGILVEFLQLNNIDFLGSTYDPLDILMYGIGVVLGIIIDLTVIDRWEKLAP